MYTTEKHVSRRLKAEDIVKHVRVEIRKGVYLPGSLLPSTNQLCQAYDVSPMTAHKVFRMLEEEKLIYRVQGRGSFVCEAETRNKSYTVGLAFAMAADDPVWKADSGVYVETLGAGLRQKGHATRYLAYHELKDPGVCPALLEGVDGVIASHGFIDARTTSLLRQWGKPVVVVNHNEILDEPFHQIVPDLRAGLMEAARHLVEGGHAAVTIVSAAYRISEYRAKVFRSVCAELGLPDESIHEIIVEPSMGYDSRQTGRKAGELFLAGGKSTTAIFSVSDLLSFGLVDTFTARGVKLGEDVGITSYDDLEGYGYLPFGAPVLTSINPRKRRIAELAEDLLLSCVDNNPGESIIKRSPVEFVIRKSSGGGT